MIRCEAEQGWLVVPQPAHALLSALLAAHWADTPVFPRPDPWAEVLVAISQHDIGWVEWEQAPKLTPEGWPRHFTELDLDDHLAIWQRGVRWGLCQSPLLAYMISRHATTLYASRCNEDPRIETFLAAQHRLQGELIKQIPYSLAALDTAYTLLRLTDWLSLVLCMERYRAGSVRVGSGDVVLEVSLLPDGRLTVEPWPFAPERVNVHVTAYRLYRRTFSDETDLRQALNDAEPLLREWELTRV